MLLASARLFADETRVPVLDPGRGRTKAGCFWTIARDDRPWGGVDPPAVVYSYAPSRGQEHSDKLLGAYRGIVQYDGYATYRALATQARRGRRGAVYCWSHVRRGFYDLAKAGAAPIATEALARIAALYRIEADVRGKAARHRIEVRQAKSRPLVADLRVWLEAQAAKLPARDSTTVAIRYALNHWDGLGRFFDDGRVEFDTNSVERAMRSVALPIKNSLFAGSDEGAANRAAVASLVETCELSSVEPHAYLTDLLTGLVHNRPNTRINELMPSNWSKSAVSPPSSL